MDIDPSHYITEPHVLRIEVGVNQVMAIPWKDMQWIQRYGDVIGLRFQVASVLDTFDYLLSSNLTQAEAVNYLKILRKERSRLKKEQGLKK